MTTETKKLVKIIKLLEQRETTFLIKTGTTALNFLRKRSKISKLNFLRKGFVESL